MSALALTTVPAHAPASSAAGGLAYAPPLDPAATGGGGGPLLLTAGADGGLTLRRSGAPGEVVASVATSGEGKPPLTAVAVAPGGETVVVADEDNFVRSYTYPALTIDKVVTRFTLPPRCLAFSPTGATLAAAGDADGVKLLSLADGAVLRTLATHSYARGLAFDPEGAFVAVLGGQDGALTVWKADSGVRAALVRAAGPRVDTGGPHRAGLAWHPDGGAVLAVAAGGDDASVALIERLSWRAADRPLTGGHLPDARAVTALAFSPNGLYLASGADDGSIAVWEFGGRTLLARAAAGGGGVAALAWAPAGNELSVATVDGGLAVWAAPVPADGGGLAPDADPDAAMAEEEGEEEEAGEDDDDVSDDGDRGGGRGGDRARRTPPPARPLHRPQPPIAPGASHPPPSAPHRWLAYTLDGSISSRPAPGGGGHAVVEVTLHDVAARRVPLVNDYYGFHLASLSPRGALYAAPPAADGGGGVLTFRPFGGWAGGGDWSADLPPGQPVRALAASGACAAAITGPRTLRLFTLAGVQTAVVSLPGDGVALAARGRVLAVVCHAGAPSCPRDQCLSLSLLSSDAGAAVAPPAPLPLSPGATLTWLAFADDGRVVTFDSAGVLRLRGADAASPWTPAFDAAAVPGLPDGAAYWPVGVRAGKLHAVLCSREAPWPGARPLVTVEPLAPPALALDGDADGGSARAADALLAVAAAAAARLAAADPALPPPDADAADAALGAAELAADRALLQLFNAAVRAGALERALEVAACLATQRALEGAFTLATRARASALAEKVAALVDARAAGDPGAAGAAAGPPQQPQYVSAAAAGGLDAVAAVVAPSPAAGGGAGDANPFLRAAAAATPLAPRDANTATPAGAPPSSEKRAAAGGGGRGPTRS